MAVGSSKVSSNTDLLFGRHGARLDAADKSWHLTSPTPYDPPLTYGGWVQSRALGLRIASLLHSREQQVDSPNNTPRGSPRPDAAHSTGTQDGAHGKAKEKTQKKRKHKVVVHSSPFQRCVQTGVGISAGLSQYQGLSSSARKGSDTRIHTVRQLHSASPRLSAVDSLRLESISEPLERVLESKEKTLAQQDSNFRATLRVDAFLGEWLSPDYFEMITHPPNSLMMVTAAKGNLLRTSENIDAYTPTQPKAAGMWGNHSPSSSPTNSPLRPGQRRDRSSSHSSIAATPTRSTNGRRSSPYRLPPDPISSHESAGYVPPAPTYAVSPVDPIPRGYVAHAKEACVNVDYQWDSMREPHYWGDGGTYGEEWSQMHKRFRRGLNSMLEWYTQDHSQATNKPESGVDGAEDDDEDTDLVLVLVTHGAGCNALIGALTNSPVLLDVGMASLTMAVRKGNADLSAPLSRVSTPAKEDTDPLGHARPPIRRNSLDLGLSKVYDLKVVASSDHLRPGVDPAQSSLPAPSSPMLASQKPPEYRRRYGSTAHAAAGAPVESNWNVNEPAGRSASSIAPSGMRRGSVATAAPQKMRTYSLAAAAQVNSALEDMKIQTSVGSPSGLWSSPTMEKPPSPGPDFVLDFSNSPDSSLPTSRSASRPTSRPASAADTHLASGAQTLDDVSPRATTPVDQQAADEAAEIEKEAASAVSDLPAVGAAVPHSLGRSLSQKGLWGSAPSGLVSRERGVAKRRWTLQQEGQ